MKTGVLKRSFFIFFLVGIGNTLYGTTCTCDNDGDGKPDAKYGTTNYNSSKTISAHFSPKGDTVKITTTVHEISNIVVKYADGSVYKYDNLTGYTKTITSSSLEIIGVWVKAGNNKSGDGPGYGEFIGNLNSSQNPNWCNCTPLPVTLVSFEAKKDNYGKVQLSWTTVMEINNSHFDIERSLDGAHFEVFADVLGNGNSDRIINYSYLDNSSNPKNGIYYRLRQVDFNGEFSFSPVIWVASEGADISLSTNVFPNPLKGSTATLNINSAETGNALVEIYSMSGAVVFNASYAVDKGANEKMIELSTLKNGLYIIRTIVGNSTSSTRVCIER